MSNIHGMKEYENWTTNTLKSIESTQKNKICDYFVKIYNGIAFIFYLSSQFMISYI
jgi:hypothetical protein